MTLATVALDFELSDALHCQPFREAYGRFNGMVVVGEGLADRHFRLLGGHASRRSGELLRLGAMEGHHARESWTAGAISLFVPMGPIWPGCWRALRSGARVVGPYLRSLAQIHRGGGTLSDLNSAEQAELWALADPHDRRCLRSRPAAARQRVAPDLNPKKPPGGGGLAPCRCPGESERAAKRRRRGGAASEGRFAPVAGTDADRLLYWGDEDLAVADFTGVGGVEDGADRGIHLGVGDHHHHL